MTRAPRKIWLDGLWHNNPGLVQLLGLCPLLAVTDSAVKGIGLAAATLFVLVASNLVISLVRGLLIPEIRIAAFVLIIATAVTATDLFVQAWLHALSLSLGIFVPLIVTNCTILARAESFASQQPAGRSVADGLAQGAGFGLVLIFLGAARELLGRGTVLADANLLFGPAAASLRIQILPADWEMLLAVLPPGAFIALGLLVALRQYIDNRGRDSADAEPGTTEQTQ